MEKINAEVRNEELDGVPQGNCKSTLSFANAVFVCELVGAHKVHQEAGELQDGSFYNVTWEEKR